MSKLGHLCSGAQPALPRPLRRRLLDIHSRPRTVPEVPGGSVAAPDPVMGPFERQEVGDETCGVFSTVRVFHHGMIVASDEMSPAHRGSIVARRCRSRPALAGCRCWGSSCTRPCQPRAKGSHLQSGRDQEPAGWIDGDARGMIAISGPKSRLRCENLPANQKVAAD